MEQHLRRTQGGDKWRKTADLSLASEPMNARGCQFFEGGARFAPCRRAPAGT
jgi:hypothetical protein